MNKLKFEDVIERDGRLIYSSRGCSMLPLIREGRDLVVIVKPVGRIKKYDAVLYRRDSGQYVLHRVMKVRAKDYLICGDNCLNCEEGITDRHIIGVLSAVIRDGREFSVADWRYKLYVSLWCRPFAMRPILLRLLRIIRRLKTKHE